MKFNLVKINSVKPVEYVGLVYDLTVKDDHSYNISGVIVHNSICKTRNMTGFGVPTLQSVIDCNKAKDHVEFNLIADGGVMFNGDIMKAIAGGADMVMLGRMLSSTSLSGGEKIEDDTNKYVVHVGLASSESRAKLGGKGSIEGVSGLIEYTGETSEFFDQLLDNMASSMVYYGGCTTWKEFQERVEMVRITESGIRESLTIND